MSKGIIVVDVPENCMECEYRLTNGYCIPSRKDIFKFALSKQKPDWCPIQPMPEKKPLTGEASSPRDVLEEVLRAGYNTCIDEILEGAYKD